MTEGNSQQRDTSGGDVFSSPAVIAAAHELKAPLALIRQLSLYSEQTDDPVARERMLHQITLTSEQALRLTTDLTRASRLEDSLFTLEPLNPATVCEEVVREAQPLYTAHGRRVCFKARQRTVLGVANRDLLRRVLLNFVDNALHYGQSSEPVVVTTAVKNSGSSIRLSVRDYGPSIPMKTWQVLRERLGTSSQPLPNRPASSGLGLFIAKQFADEMHASLGAVRHQDGVTFYIDINSSTQMRLL